MDKNMRNDTLIGVSLEELVASKPDYKQFFDDMWEEYCEQRISDIDDAETVVILAMKAGLVKEEKYDPDIHGIGIVDPCDMATGDPIYIRCTSSPRRESSDLFTIASAPKDGTKIKTICLGNDTASCFATTSWHSEIQQFANDEMMKRHNSSNYWNYSPTHWKPLTDFDVAQDKANAACISASLPEINTDIEDGVGNG